MSLQFENVTVGETFSWLTIWTGQRDIVVHPAKTRAEAVQYAGQYKGHHGIAAIARVHPPGRMARMVVDRALGYTFEYAPCGPSADTSSNTDTPTTPSPSGSSRSARRRAKRATQASRCSKRS